MDKGFNSGSVTTNPDTPFPKRTRWDATPLGGRNLNEDIKKRQPADKTPLRADMTPSRFSETPMRSEEVKGHWNDKTPLVGSTPASYMGATPTPSQLKTPDIMQNASKLKELRWWHEIQRRNRPYTDQ